MSSSHKAVAAVVAVLAIIGVIVVAMLVFGGPGGVAEQSASPIATATATEPETTTQPSAEPSSPDGSPGADEEELLETLAAIEDQVVEIRGLEAADIGPPDLITRDELGDELERIFEEEYPEEDQRRDNIALRALGLLEPDQDAAELQLELLGDQVLGFYDDIDKRMVVVTDVGLDAEAKVTYAHEYTHALQDAAFGLDSLQTDAVGEDDRALARTALIEGDATVAMLAWAFQHLSPQELAAVGSTPIPDMSGIPSWMVDQLQFPYLDGVTWAGQLAGNPLEPDFTDLDAAFADPPASTEQIIHIDAWLDREEPVEVGGVDLAAALGDGWEEVDATPIGEAMIEIMLTYFGVDSGTAGSAAEGWGGDEAVIASGPDDAFAVSWRLAWDTVADATEFADAYRSVADDLPFPVRVEELTDGSILVGHASDDEILDQTVEVARDALP